MPLEIRELIVRVAVVESESKPFEVEMDKKIQEMKSKVVKECIENILDKIDTLNTR
jgi:Family of unknown function (DUF5908)